MGGASSTLPVESLERLSTESGRMLHLRNDSDDEWFSQQELDQNALQPVHHAGKGNAN